MFEWLKKLFMVKKSEEAMTEAPAAAPETPEQTAGGSMTGNEGAAEETGAEDLK